MFLGQSMRLHHISILHCIFVFIYEYLVPPKTQFFSIIDMAEVHTHVCVCTCMPPDVVCENLGEVCSYRQSC